MKDLRRTVAELQCEVIKAGELITLYSNRLIEGSLPIDDKNHVEGVVHVCIEERKSTFAMNFFLSKSSPN